MITGNTVIMMSQRIQRMTMGIPTRLQELRPGDTTNCYLTLPRPGARRIGPGPTEGIEVQCLTLPYY